MAKQKGTPSVQQDAPQYGYKDVTPKQDEENIGEL